MMSETTANVEDESAEDVVVQTEEKVRTITPYEKKLRTEAKMHRDRAKAAETAAAEQIAKARSDAEAMVAGERAKANERLIRAELKAHAIKAGIVDIDILRLADVSSVKLTDSGDVEGAEALIAALKVAKPYAFGGSSSSSTAKAPEVETMKPKLARDMSEDEYKAELRKYGVRR